MKRYKYELRRLNCRSLVPLLIACTLLAACRGSGDSAKSIQETTQARTVSAGPAVPTENSESCKPGGIFIFPGKHEGVIQSDLESAGTVFSAAEDCHTVLLNVRSAQKAHLIARAASYLVASRRVVIDTNGSDEEIALAADIARTLAGAGATTAGISIVQIQEGVMAVTPIETEDAYRQRQSVSRKPASKGNTARYVLGLN